MWRALLGETRVLENGGGLQLNYSSSSPPVAGALGVIGLSGRTRQEVDARERLADIDQ